MSVASRSVSTSARRSSSATLRHRVGRVYPGAPGTGHRAVRKGRALCFTPRAPAGAYGAAAFRAPSNSTSAARPAGRARTPRTALPPAAAAAAPVGSTTARPPSAATQPSTARRWRRSSARRCRCAPAAVRQAAHRDEAPSSGPPQPLHGRTRIGSARWARRCRNTADIFSPCQVATWRYEVPATSAASTSTRAGWAQTVHALIAASLTESNQVCNARDRHVATPPTTQPPRRDPTIGGGASPSARRVKLGSSCTPTWFFRVRGRIATAGSVSSQRRPSRARSITPSASMRANAARQSRRR